MKVFSLGKLAAVLVAVGAVSVSYKVAVRRRPVTGHDIWIENLTDKTPEKIEIHNKRTPLPPASDGSDTPAFSVPLENMSAGRPSFPGYHIEGKVLYELRTVVTMADGIERRTEYDMATGEVLRVLVLSADGRRIEVYDGKGVLLETQVIE
jgi:hypothetical protein